MTRPYYTARNRPTSLSLDEFHTRMTALYRVFRDRDYFKQKTGIARDGSSESLSDESSLYLGFQAFPFNQWRTEDITDDRVMDVIEFLWDRVSKPGEWGEQYSDGVAYHDYYSYDEEAGKEEFRRDANLFLAEWQEGFELNPHGHIQRLGSHGLHNIFAAEIVPYDEANVDSKVRMALSKWRARQSSSSDKVEAVRIMADVFEFLRDSKQLSAALNKKDESALFDIANNFAIRHHNFKQKSDYDPAIWYAWMFHFYLATYHAAVRLIGKAKSGP